ncbi:30S ribosomal protein S6e [Candidatus Tiddalikarchaeum anstoanum]|nr:30S ribosomal protein S6e [Candidatus Tiddalikarchaeum anstoanum]
MKIVISDPKTGKSYQKVLDKSVEDQLYQKKVGDTLNGELFDLQGYQFLITGGSDKSGFPIRPEIKGSKRSRILLSKGVGLKNSEKGYRTRKTVRGHTLNEEIEQVNTKITKYGTANLDEIFKKAPKEGEEKKK